MGHGNKKKDKIKKTKFFTFLEGLNAIIFSNNRSVKSIGINEIKSIRNILGSAQTRI